MSDKSILIFTGGHHTSALAVANELRSQGCQIIWFGHRHSMWQDTSDSAEYREVTAAGVPFYELKAGKFYHLSHPSQFIRLPFGFIQAFFLLLKLKIRYGHRIKGIFSSGGYLAVPVVFCGWLMGIPSLTHEQTVVAGWANRFIAHFAKKIALTWPSSQNNYPLSKTKLTGLPLRPEISSITKRLPVSPPLILVMGGKQGSHAINEVIFSAQKQLTLKYQIIHQVGSNSVYHDFQTAQNLANKYYTPYEYFSPSELSHMYQTCSLVISRAGAHITYELAFLGIPSILIPLPVSSHDEQLKNAQYLKEQGSSTLLLQSDLSVKNLLIAIDTAFHLVSQPLDVPQDGLKQVVQLIKQELLYV